MFNWLHTVFSTETREARPLSCPGSRLKDDRLLQMVDGHYELVTVGQSDLYQEIQSHKDSVDIYKLLDRYRNGDISALQHVQGQYLDLVDAPKTLAEAYEFIHNAKAFFEKLPLDIRKEYDHDASKFVADLGSDHSHELFAKVFKSERVDFSADADVSVADPGSSSSGGDVNA